MRESRYDIDDFFKHRFSPREFTDREICEDDFNALLEAASTSPSCYNEQPWRFIVSRKKKFLDILASANAEWAKDAQRFILLCAEPNFLKNGKFNTYAGFDCGASLAYMTFEAHKRDICVHAMAGFDKEMAKELFELDGLIPLAVVALGYTTQKHTMTPRKGLDEIVIKR